MQPGEHALSCRLYARANVERALVKSQEAAAHERWLRERSEDRCRIVEDQREELRAECERLDNESRQHIRQALENGQAYHEQKARAEQLTETLREARTRIVALCACYRHPTPDATLERIDAALEQESRR